MGQNSHLEQIITVNCMVMMLSFKEYKRNIWCRTSASLAAAAFAWGGLYAAGFFWTGGGLMGFTGAWEDFDPCPE